MKKNIFLIGALLIAGTFLGSCRKDYLCQCSKTYTTGSGSSTQNYSEYTYKDTKTRAIDRCNANTATGSDLGGDYSINCEIK